MRAIGVSSFLVTACVLACSSCKRQPDAGTQLQQAEKTFEKAEQGTPQPVTPAEPVPAATSVQAAPAAAPAQEMKQAIAAYKAGQLEDAVTRLQKLRATPVMAPQQRMALQDAVAAVMAEVYALAEKGDPRAQQAVKRYEQMQTSR